MKIELKHKPTGKTGTFLKSYDVTGGVNTTQIETSDGRIYYAPTTEFIKL